MRTSTKRASRINLVSDHHQCMLKDGKTWSSFRVRQQLNEAVMMSNNAVDFVYPEEEASIRSEVGRRVLYDFVPPDLQQAQSLFQAQSQFQPNIFHVQEVVSASVPHQPNDWASRWPSCPDDKHPNFSRQRAK